MKTSVLEHDMSLFIWVAFDARFCMSSQTGIPLSATFLSLEAGGARRKWCRYDSAWQGKDIYPSTWYQPKYGIELIETSVWESKEQKNHQTTLMRETGSQYWKVCREWTFEGWGNGTRHEPGLRRLTLITKHHTVRVEHSNIPAQS